MLPRRALLSRLTLLTGLIVGMIGLSLPAGDFAGPRPLQAASSLKKLKRKLDKTRKKTGKVACTAAEAALKGAAVAGSAVVVGIFDALTSDDEETGTKDPSPGAKHTASSKGSRPPSPSGASHVSREAFPRH